MKLSELENILTDRLEIRNYSSDRSLNGVQVGDLDKTIRKIALLVDVSIEGIAMAKKIGADMIFCHHGLFWGSPLAIKGPHYKRVKALIDSNIALFACHLPLDAHMELGNNIGLAKKLRMKEVTPFSKYKGVHIGVKGEVETPLTVDEVKKLLLGENEPAYIIPGGTKEIRKIGIVSGGSPFSVYDAINDNLDLFITGDRSHEVYHTCLEAGINMISAGHYATETLGVQQVGEWITKELDIPTQFIDIPTGV